MSAATDSTGAARIAPDIREIQVADLASVVELDASLTGEKKPGYWSAVVERFLSRESCIALAATSPGGPGDELDGFLFGERRAFEFGSEACGWILAVGVRRSLSREGIATALMEEARHRFRAMGVTAVRTMVRRTDVPLLSYFRSQGFVGGPFVQLELGLGEASDQEARR